MTGALVVSCLMSDARTEEEQFNRWHRPWKARVCGVVRSFSHGTVFRSQRHPDFWEYNCIRLDRAMDASEMVLSADRELADCAHRLVEWMIPMPDPVVSELRDAGWIATPLIFMLHDGRALPADRGELNEVDHDEVRELRDIWHREDFGEHADTDASHAQPREVAQLAQVRVIAALQDGQPVGFAQVETHDGASEIAQVFVHPDRRSAGLGTALTSHAVQVGANAAPDVWICAERDDRPRELYQRLGFHK